MRPARRTPAHQTDRLAELVCSNSLKSEQVDSAPWLLKEELRRLDSLLLAAARKGARARRPCAHGRSRHLRRGGHRRDRTRAAHRTAPRRGHATSPRASSIIATGPLTSDALAAEISRLTGSDRLFFYDSISPIVDADTVDHSIAFWASRYGKSSTGTDDYLNCPFDKEQYERFLDELLKAESVDSHIAEDDTPYFEACLPIEEIARRGRDTLRFGPMKPMGLTDPRTGRRPWAVVQLRQENLRAASFNLVGFQNHLKFGEQARILRMIPGLEHAEFIRFGQIHRNTYINAPALLTPTLQLRSRPEVFFAGQISGVEGYVEVDRDRPARRHARRRARHRQRAPGHPARDRARLALPLRLGRRPRALPAREHHVRSAAAARRRHAPPPPPRQEGAPRRSLPPRAGGVRRVSARPCLSWPARSSAIEQELTRTGASSHTLAAYSQRSAPVSRIPLAARNRAARARGHRPADSYASGSPRSTRQNLDVISIRRKLAAVRSFFRYMVREGVIPLNTARLVRTPKAPKRLPDVPSAEQVNTLLDGVASGKLERPHPARDRAIFELLYGCGMRVSELVGLNLDDIDRSEGWLRAARQGPQGAPGSAAPAGRRSAGALSRPSAPSCATSAPSS